MPPPPPHASRLAMCPGRRCAGNEGPTGQELPEAEYLRLNSEKDIETRLLLNT